MNSKLRLLPQVQLLLRAKEQQQSQEEDRKRKRAVEQQQQQQQHEATIASLKAHIYELNNDRKLKRGRIATLESRLHTKEAELEDAEKRAQLTDTFEKDMLEFSKRPTVETWEARVALLESQLEEERRRTQLVLKILQHRKDLPADIPWHRLDAVWSEIRFNQLRSSQDKLTYQAVHTEKQYQQEKANREAIERQCALREAEIRSLKKENNQKEQSLEKEKTAHADTKRRWREEVRRLRADDDDDDDDSSI